MSCPIRSSGPVTPHRLPCPAWCRSRPICQPRCSARYKCSLVPRRFSLQLPPSFPPLSSPARLLLPRRASPAFQTILKPCGPHTNSYDRAKEKNGAARPPARVRFVPRNTLSFQPTIVLIRLSLDPTFLAGGLAPTVTSMACLVFPVAATRSVVGPESRHPCHLPRDLLNRSTNQPRGPAVLRPRHRTSRVSTTRGCLTAPGHCPILARFLRQTRLEMWIGQLTRHSKRGRHRLLPVHSRSAIPQR